MRDFFLLAFGAMLTLAVVAGAVKVTAIPHDAAGNVALPTVAEAHAAHHGCIGKDDTMWGVMVICR